MSNPNLILIGAGGHANSCIDVIEQQSYFKIAGLIGLSRELGTERLGYPVIGSDEDLTRLVKIYRYALVTVGQIKTAQYRIELYNKIQQLGFESPTIIAKTAYVSKHATIGIGSIIMNGAVINAGASIGINCIINTKALIEHDVHIANNCHISTGAILNGGATVGSNTFIGSGSVIHEMVSVGSECVIGAGATICQDIKNKNLVKKLSAYDQENLNYR